jgi:signal transduction histidine kinase/ActR/RegA family two-component response regulator
MHGGWVAGQFDNRTAVQVGSIAALSISLLSVLLWGTRRTYPGFARWMLGNCCAGLSMAALALRGVVPDWLSIVVTNAAAFAGVVLLLEGNREFLHLSPVYTPARVLAGLSMAAQIYFFAIVDNLSIRILVSSFCIAVLTAASAVTLFRGVRTNRRLSFLFAGSFFMINAFCNFARGIAAWMAWPAPDLFAATLVNQVYFGGMTITVIGWAMGFILLTNDRLIEDLTLVERHTAELNQELQAATEQAKAAARHAAEANRAKSDFLAYMGHEIRNPLSGVLVLSELILTGPLTEEKRGDVETLRGSAHSVLGILNDVLDLSKVEAGQMSIVAAPFNLETELTQIADLFWPQARAKSTLLHLAYPLDAPRWFEGDGPRVRQIISNFTSNAVKFTDNGEVVIEVEQKARHVRISVRDTGIGIAPGTLPLLFSKFIQAEPSARYRGTGLGLAISKQLAELMGGSVGAESLEGRGSTFWVELPLNPVDGAVPRETRDCGPREVALAGSRVLLAEDNEFSQRVISKLLESHGMVVDVVACGRDAVARFEQTKYAVVLMDCQMPEMDGYEATRRIRAWETGRAVRTPVIAITAHSMANERNRCQTAGMDDYLVKPVTPAQLLECIATHLARKPDVLLKNGRGASVEGAKGTSISASGESGRS